MLSAPDVLCLWWLGRGCATRAGALPCPCRGLRVARPRRRRRQQDWRATAVARAAVAVRAVGGCDEQRVARSVRVKKKKTQTQKKKKNNKRVVWCLCGCGCVGWTSRRGVGSVD